MIEYNLPLGFDYQFDALNVEKEQNELNKAFMTLFHAERSITFLDIIQMYFPVLRNLVSNEYFPAFLLTIDDPKYISSRQNASEGAVRR